MKISKRGRIVSIRFEKTKKDQGAAKVLLNAMAGRPLDEPLQAEPEASPPRKKK